MTDPVDHARATLEALPDSPAALTAEHLDLVRAAAEGSARQAAELRSRQIDLTAALLAGNPPDDAEEEAADLLSQHAQLLAADELLAPYLLRAAEIEQGASEQAAPDPERPNDVSKGDTDG